MSKFSIDYERTTTITMRSGMPNETHQGVVKVWEAPPAGISYEGAIMVMHERTLELAQMLETIINVLPELPVVSLPRGQRAESDGFKP